MGALTGYTIAFDLDGTLVDTAPDLIRATDQVMNEIGLPPIPYDEFRPMVGQGARALVRKASARFGVVHDDDRLEALTQRFVEIYRAGIALTSRPFPGVERALDALAAEDAILAVCTNKKTELSLLLLDALGLTDRFAAIVGGDSAPAPKPDASHLFATADAAGGARDRILLVGDTITDVQAARASGAPVILVSFGYGGIPAEQLGADAVITAFDELAPIALRLSRAQAASA